MPELLFSVSVSQSFMDVMVRRVAASVNERHPELSIAEILPDGQGVRRPIRIGKEKVSAAMMSVMNGYRTDLPASVATQMYAGIIASNPRLIGNDVIAQLGQIAVFGSVLKPATV